MSFIKICKENNWKNQLSFIITKKSIKIKWNKSKKFKKIRAKIIKTT